MNSNLQCGIPHLIPGSKAAAFTHYGKNEELHSLFSRSQPIVLQGATTLATSKKQMQMHSFPSSMSQKW